MAFIKGQKPPVKAGAKPAAKKPGFPAAGPKKVLTGAEKKAAEAKKKERLRLVSFEAPSDFRAAYFELKMVVQHDGMISPNARLERIKGSWDNPEAKRYNLAEYDVPTLVGVVSRLQASCYSSNVTRRLPAGSKFGVYLRCSANKETGLMNVSVKAAYELKGEKNKKVWFEDRANPVYRKIRRAARLLRGAFVKVQLPPSTGRRVKVDIDTAE